MSESSQNQIEGDINDSDEEKPNIPDPDLQLRSLVGKFMKITIEVNDDLGSMLRQRKNGYTPLIYACSRDFEMAKLILESKYLTQEMLSETSDSGYTPLLNACISSHQTVLLILQSRFMNQEMLRQKIGDGDTPLMLACTYQPLAVQHIIESPYMNQEILNETNLLGMSAFLLACKNFSGALGQIVMSKFMNPNLLESYNHVGETCFTYANKNTEILNVLRKYIFDNKLFKYFNNIPPTKAMIILILEEKMEITEFSYEIQTEFKWRMMKHMKNDEIKRTIFGNADICEICCVYQENICLTCLHLLCSKCYRQFERKICPRCQTPITKCMKFKNDKMKIFQNKHFT